MIGVWLFVLAAPSIIDSLIRGILLSVSRLPLDREGAFPPGKWLVLVPARSEGALVADTLRSICAEVGDRQIDVLVVLDGEDQVASELARGLGADLVVKEPPGPTKGALLAWVAEHHRERINAADAVLLVDVGSVLSPSFFEHFSWRAGFDAMQTMLRGSGQGTGEAALVSESLAQKEDKGRERLGWNVRLRGTGTALTPAAFLGLVPRLQTQVEDLEASLILSAEGALMGLAPYEAFVMDVKPHLVRDAAVQRARWFAGKLEVFVRHMNAIYRLMARRPLEGVAFVCEMLGRPLSLTILLRLFVGLWILVDGVRADRPGLLLLATISLTSALADMALLIRGGTSVGGAVRMGIAWGGALLMSPRALVQWMRARR